MLGLRRPLAIDLFCGAGGLSLGFAQAGFNVVAAVDSDPLNVATYSRNSPKTKVICADVSCLSGNKIRELCGLADDQVDVVFGGPPCQGFSAIGKRDLSDPRNTLIGEFYRLVRELTPRYFVMENVAGLMYSASRSVLEQALCGLRDDGYDWVSPIQLLDAQQFGVPQRRRRVFVLGFRNNEQPPTYPRPTMRDVTVWDAIPTFGRLGAVESFSRATSLSDVSDRPLHTP